MIHRSIIQVKNELYTINHIFLLSKPNILYYHLYFKVFLNKIIDFKFINYLYYYYLYYY